MGRLFPQCSGCAASVSYTHLFGVEVRETDGTLVETFSYDKREEICSGETSETMQYLLEKVVSEGGGKNAKIEG